MAHKLEDLKIDGPFLVVRGGVQTLILSHIERITARFEGQCSIVTSSGFEIKVEEPATKVAKWLRKENSNEEAMLDL